MARSRRYGRGKSRGYYKFTPKRKAALRKAQFVSAKNRKGSGSNLKKIATIGVLAGAGVGVAVVGYKNRDTIRKAGDWRKTASPENKERTRAANAISVGDPSRTVSITPPVVLAPRMSTPITDSDRARAQDYRNAEKRKKEKETRAITGSELEDIDAFEKQAERKSSDRQIDRQVRGVLRATKRPGGTARIKPDNTLKSPLELVEDGLPKAVRGRRTGSYKGTPGGNKTPAKTTRPNTANGLTDAEHAAAIGFDTELYTPAASYARTRGVAGLRGDPMQALRGIQAEDEKLLSGAMEPPKKAAAKKAPAKKSAAKKAAPTAGTDKTTDSKPTFSDLPPAPKPMAGMPAKNASDAELRRGALKNLGVKEDDYVDNWDILNDSQKESVRKAAAVWSFSISNTGQYYLNPF